jgi:hypothetical protein
MRRASSFASIAVMLILVGGAAADGGCIREP